MIRITGWQLNAAGLLVRVDAIVIFIFH